MPSTPKKNKTITDSVMKSVTMPLIIVEDECNVSQDQTFITEAQQPTNCESMNRAQAEDYLRSLMKVREVKVEIQFEMGETFDVTFTHNMTIKTIRSSRVLPHLLIGDQLLLVNGKAPLNQEDAKKIISQAMPKLKIVVGRVAYKESIPAKRANKIQLKRLQGNIYFLAKIQRVGPISFGMGIKIFRGKTIVNRLDENSLASYVFLIGDAICDINGEVFSDADQLRKEMVSSIKSKGYFTAVIERQDQVQMVHNVRFNDIKDVDDNVPVMMNDTRFICQREILRYEISRGKRHKPRSIIKNTEFDVNKTQGDDTFAEDEVPIKRSGLAKTKGDDSPSLSVRIIESLNLKKNKKKKRHVVISSKLEEEKVATDVENPTELKHVSSLGKHGLSKAFTFMPSFLRK